MAIYAQGVGRGQGGEPAILIRMIKVDTLTKQFGSVTALDAVDFTVPRGSICALLGPNGSGKTTLMRIVAGLLQPTSGSVSINDVPMATHPVAAKRQVGYIPDDPEAWGKMTGYEFLHFIGALHEVPQVVREKRIAELLPHFGLEPIQHTYFDQYSRGNRQKFTILAALLHEPKVLLIDEPIVGLDPDSVSTFESLLLRFVAEGGTILITTHTLAVADRIADRVGILHNAELASFATPAELKKAAGLGDDAHLLDLYHATVGQDALTTE